MAKAKCWIGSVNRRMTKRALNADGLQCAGRIENPFHTNNCVELEQGKRNGRIIEVYSAFFDGRDDVPGKNINVYFQADSQSSSEVEVARACRSSLQ